MRWIGESVRHKVAAVLPLAAFLFAVSGCGGDAGESTDAPKRVSVDIIEFSYTPETVQVAVGGTVTWGNGDTAPHTATLEDRSQDTGRLETADQKGLSFDQAGTYSYFCDFHPFMHGVVEVVG